MSSVGSHILNHKRTGGHFIGIAAGNTYAASVADLAAPTSATAGLLNSAGKVYEFTTQATAETAITTNFATAITFAAGALYEDMGDRVVYSADGQTLAIFAKVRLLNEVAYEGNERPLYLCIWAGAPGTPTATTVSVARL